jgi:hypothetical protein
MKLLRRLFGSLIGKSLISRVAIGENQLSETSRYRIGLMQATLYWTREMLALQVCVFRSIGARRLMELDVLNDVNELAGYDY